MGRPKEFDRNLVLDKAMDVFQSRGFEATSITDLVEAMGINRFTIYETFSDKHKLFLESLDNYQKKRREHMADAFRPAGPRIAIVRKYFEDIVDNAITGRAKRGCLDGQFRHRARSRRR